MFNNILTGFRKKESNTYKTSWEQARQLMYVSLIPHQKTNKQGKVEKPLKLEDVLPFPWDNKIKIESTNIDKKKLAKAKSFWDRVDETAP